MVDWLDKFEQETLAFNEEQRKAVLKCAFVKAARAWFKSDLEPKLDGLDWPAVKRLVLQRYKPGKLEYYVGLLNKLEYTPEEDLAAFVDQRVYLAKKAYPTLSDKSIIRDCVNALPSNVRSYLNLMTDTSTLEDVSELKSLASRFDRKIDITPVSSPANVLDKSLFESLLEKAVESVTDKLTERVVGRMESQVAALAKGNTSQGHDRNSNVAQIEPQSQPNQQCHRCDGHAYYQRQEPPRRQEYASRGRRYQGFRYQPQQAIQQNQNVPAQGNGRWESRRAPGPCYNCGGDHWNRDCPRNNLNAQGR